MLSTYYENFKQALSIYVCNFTKFLFMVVAIVEMCYNEPSRYVVN